MNKPKVRKARTTLADVAHEAQVSVATVSKTLHGRSDVSASTRERVESALTLLSYTPSGSPQPRRMPQVVVAFDSFNTVYDSTVLSGIMDEALDRQVRIVLDRSPDDSRPPSPREWIRRHAVSGATGAILVTAPAGNDLTSEAASLGLPLVVVDPKNPIDDTVTSIGCTNFAGAVSATEHLVGLGHTRIGFAGLHLLVNFTAERFAGFRTSLEQHGLDLDPEYISYGGTDFDFGLRAGAQFAALETPPTAVVAICDVVALGVIEGARRGGLMAPEQLSVVGFDDLSPASWSAPPLTTVHQPLSEIGALALRTVLDLAHGDAPASHHLQLATTLVVRGSTTAPCRGTDAGAPFDFAS